MFIELINTLRCIAHHADSWLVASISHRNGRFVTDGTLGCPVCLREYPIQNGVVHFGDPQRPAPTTTSAARNDAVQPLHADAVRQEAAREIAIRIGAFLAVTEGATVLLAGDWARGAHALSELVPSRIFILNPSGPISDSTEESESVGVIVSSDALPVAPGSLRGVALDRPNATRATLLSAVKALASGGRLVAPADAVAPSGVSVIARDEQFWVAERTLPLLALVHR